MSDESQFGEELAGLAREVAEAATYLRELGADGLEGLGAFVSAARAAPAQEPPSPFRPAAQSPALARNALAERHEQHEQHEQHERPSPPAARPLQPPQPPSTQTQATTQTSGPRAFKAPPRVGGPPSTLYQTEMPKRPVRKPSPDPPAPRETLFGEIAPKDELSLGRPGETFEDIREDVGECVRCPLHKGRTNIVHTEGSREARLMFVGEAPGADEDASGRPFVGRAGQLLNKIIEAIGLTREDVLIGNVNRCRPPGNRTPTTEEARTCKPFLLREIAVARPEVIIVLGNTAMKNLLDTKEGITRLRGEFQDYQGIKVMPTFHPAYLLRDPSKKREVWEDLKKVRDYLNATKK
ncbi:MAG TPA: uracil-DNA glycosylase family protein [Pyrinomonadaceae bacterium]|nr:uracil-DNA glycosylase family protein [Pyrinomonadaceae bacterium]